MSEKERETAEYLLWERSNRKESSQRIYEYVSVWVLIIQHGVLRVFKQTRVSEMKNKGRYLLILKYNKYVSWKRLHCLYFRKSCFGAVIIITRVDGDAVMTK